MPIIKKARKKGQTDKDILESLRVSWLALVLALTTTVLLLFSMVLLSTYANHKMLTQAESMVVTGENFLKKAAKIYVNASNPAPDTLGKLLKAFPEDSGIVFRIVNKQGDLPEKPSFDNKVRKIELRELQSQRELLLSNNWMSSSYVYSDVVFSNPLSNRKLYLASSVSISNLARIWNNWVRWATIVFCVFIWVMLLYAFRSPWLGGKGDS